MNSKAGYARSQGQTRPHTCHWPGCGRQVPPSLWGCKEHWFKLPAEVRRRIWETYRPGQEIDCTPSEAYVVAARAAQRWIAAHLKAAPKPAEIDGELAAAIAATSTAAQQTTEKRGRETVDVYYLGMLARMFLAWGIEPRRDHSHADPAVWRDEPAKEGRIRTVCKICGGFIGYRWSAGSSPTSAPVSSADPGGRRVKSGKSRAGRGRKSRPG